MMTRFKWYLDPLPPHQLKNKAKKKKKKNAVRVGTPLTKLSGSAHVIITVHSRKLIRKVLSGVCGCTGWSVPLLFAYNQIWFSCAAGPISLFS